MDPAIMLHTKWFHAPLSVVVSPKLQYRTVMKV
ncbi:hypothetical protein II1_03047 [Bacillus cereus MC118]|uniref:Uncharacterized protein n=1 Tax=Bacillus cereus MC67 TaxID=1053219 RepID=J8F1Z1_BACCE|nr:hypothetical protein II3_01104 [Bacillus cereus MC67]EOP13843.1 hypothetical protein II1_03047 [Bacillus cereus MC118]